MKAVIAAGGTAGHINPALAIAGEIMKNGKDSSVVFFGREDGMEKKLVEQAGYRMIPLETHGFVRSFKPKDVLENMNSVRCAMQAERICGEFFREFQPDVVIGCGGYNSGPVVEKAARMGIPTAIQEQNSFPGVTTKLLSKRVDRIFTANAEAIKRIGYPKKSVVSGNPVRAEFYTADRALLRKKWGIGDRICILSFGGSLGARTINSLSARLMQLNRDNPGIFHIHAMGQYAVESFPKLLADSGVDINSPRVCVKEYIDNMPQCYAAADLIISRSGAITISEIEAAGRASVLIPSPNVTENHQYYNALTLKNVNAALLFEETDIDIDAVADDIVALAADPQRLRMMGVNARALAVPNTSKLIYDNLVRLIEEKKG
ncbi:MAG: UDP-N-acetylglucosamine--N-acetylmuramyl-(pentapeptide) pyrophosphoryl-undecaprenol N-acetylglucosamine transferase [Oscillospiraceae bacterium]|nr:UDP-N-acetylglucosamine--N-acetylmuramyl-(pentapeptide) pyrophosphoryl-undecaprenol N-acetylglucosamine transferase [Oscillospiraceae bacterium]